MDFDALLTDLQMSPLPSLPSIGEQDPALSNETNLLEYLFPAEPTNGAAAVPCLNTSPTVINLLSDDEECTMQVSFLVMCVTWWN